MPAASEQVLRRRRLRSEAHGGGGFPLSWLFTEALQAIVTGRDDLAAITAAVTEKNPNPGRLAFVYKDDPKAGELLAVDLLAELVEHGYVEPWDGRYRLTQKALDLPEGPDGRRTVELPMPPVGKSSGGFWLDEEQRREVSRVTMLVEAGVPAALKRITDGRLRSGGEMAEQRRAALRASIEQNGWLPGSRIIVDQHERILSGHTRAAVLEEMGQDWRGDAAKVLRIMVDSDAHALRVGLGLNVQSAMAPTELKRLAEVLVIDGWTPAEIGEAVGAAERTVQLWTAPVRKQKKAERDAEVRALAESGHTQQEIADELGVPQRTVSDALSGNRNGAETAKRRGRGRYMDDPEWRKAAVPLVDRWIAEEIGRDDVLVALKEAGLQGSAGTLSALRAAREAELWAQATATPEAPTGAEEAQAERSAQADPWGGRKVEVLCRCPNCGHEHEREEKADGRGDDA